MDNDNLVNSQTENTETNNDNLVSSQTEHPNTDNNNLVNSQTESLQTNSSRIKQKRIPYASINKIKFRAIKAGNLRYSNFEQAKEELDSLKQKYLRSDKKSDPNSTSSVVFWVDGYKLTNDEVQKGFVGNFAKVFIKQLPDSLYTILMEKIPEELGFHPKNRKWEIREDFYPNRSHPTLRLAEKKEKFQKEEDAQNELEKLHLKFPKSAVPATKNKLYLKIYSRQFKKSKNVKKFILEVKKDESGEFFLDLRENLTKGLSVKYKFDEVLDTISSYLVEIKD